MNPGGYELPKGRQLVCLPDGLAGRTGQGVHKSKRSDFEMQRHVDFAKHHLLDPMTCKLQTAIIPASTPNIAILRSLGAGSP